MMRSRPFCLWLRGTMITPVRIVVLVVGLATKLTASRSIFRIIMYILHFPNPMACCFFFLFKRKTSYEMRISDWSSDVCSSDLTPVVAFYILLDWDKMVNKVDSWIPRDQSATVRRLARDMDAAIAGFVRGQGSICTILGIFYAVGLSLIGLNFGLLIGFAAGMISFIPYIGSFVGLILSIGVALVQFRSEEK